MGSSQAFITNTDRRTEKTILISVPQGLELRFEVKITSALKIEATVPTDTFVTFYKTAISLSGTDKPIYLRTSF
jgi:hypothetical protein